MTIFGSVTIELGGVRRKLSCDMNAADVLYSAFGEHWVLWILERFIGIRDKEGAYKLHAVSPREVVTALYALLATDRKDSGIAEDEESISRLISFSALRSVQITITNAVIASFGVPGEAKEAAGKAGSGPQRIAPAKTRGTGKRR